jgi:hypothetical protein
MKHLRTYEGYRPPLQGDPLVGEYVIISSEDYDDDEKDFFENNVGQIVDDVTSDLANYRTYNVKFSNPPKDIEKNLLNKGRLFVWDSEIVKHSHNKEELELYISAKKYNL